MPTQTNLSKPDAVISVAPACGIFGSSFYVGDEEGFCARVLDNWHTQTNNGVAQQTPQHIEAAQHLYAFYTQYRSNVDSNALSGGSMGRLLRTLMVTADLSLATEEMNREIALAS